MEQVRMSLKDIDHIFLTTLLQISIGGVSFILISDFIISPEDVLSLIIDAVVLSACVISYVLRKNNPVLSILIVTIITLLSVFFLSLQVPIHTTLILAITMLIGFIFSILLTGRVLHIMHSFSVLIIICIFVFQYFNPADRFLPENVDLLTNFFTFMVLYFIITYATANLKGRYDRAHEDLSSLNKEIETQNEELIQYQDDLNRLNRELEQKVDERTDSLKIKTETLLKYSYTNAHHLRGPIARLLGLVMIQRMENNPDNSFFFDKVEQQALEIDEVVKQINIDLEQDETGHFEKE